MRISKFKTDEKKACDGVWFDFQGEADEKPLRLLIAKAGNSKFRDFVRKATRPYQQQILSNSLPISILEDINLKATAHYILLDWEGLEDESGNEIKYSSEESLRMLQHVEFMSLVTRFSNTVEAFREIDEEQVVGN